ncbi:fumarylacetoacetate hydrolase family protein [Rhodopseudomonas sp. P2A-2r]|uniref:2-keto-4-pentenoate hydratase n=1 Tax=Rhodopseudomonas sp. P2A-2r TaxID=2991972 RepID=UPI002234C0D3|nr:fumarylacetoacetate hydrolase family protein [Rhodopseudomonas sp. P2A-2r]UZE51320.1 fumarylacetoacetate hydrolase family protein [Rhodopseudomonas sp. P2A-2r]
MTDISAATIIADARRARVPLHALGADAPHDEAEGYRVQDAVHQQLAAELGRLAGHKIGCTSAVMQSYLGIPHPCAGGIFASGVHLDGASLRHGDYVRVGVECEIAVRLARDVAAHAAPHTAQTIVDAIDAYLPAIELVDDRYADWSSLGAPTLIADDFFAAGCVLGAPVPRGALPDLLSVVGRAVINGQEVGRGSGADVLGHPHNALAWLANHLAAQGKSLRAGEIVLTGSLVQTVWLNAGDAAVMEMSGLGNVAVEFR